MFKGKEHPADPLIRIWDSMLNQGVPVIHVLDLVKKHIAALDILPDDTENKEVVLLSCRNYELHLLLSNKTKE
jgi:hypothetical protein